jgi:hypothetical protein
MEPQTTLDTSDTIPSVLHYTLEKSVVDDVNEDLAHKIVDKRQQQHVMSSQTEPNAINLENFPPQPCIQGLNLDNDKPLEPPYCDLAASETQGSTQARVELRQLENMVTTSSEQVNLLKAYLSQLISSPPPQLEETQLIEPLSARAKALQLVDGTPKLQLSARKLKELNRRKAKQDKQVAKTRVGQRRAGNTGHDVIDCQCGSKAEGDNATVRYIHK